MACAYVQMGQSASALTCLEAVLENGESICARLCVLWGGGGGVEPASKMALLWEVYPSTKESACGEHGAEALQAGVCKQCGVLIQKVNGSAVCARPRAPPACCWSGAAAAAGGGSWGH